MMVKIVSLFLLYWENDRDILKQLYCVVLVASLSQKDNRNSVSKFQYFCSLTLPKFKEQELSHLRCRFSHLYYLLIAEKSP